MRKPLFHNYIIILMIMIFLKEDNYDLIYRNFLYIVISLSLMLKRHKDEIKKDTELKNICHHNQDNMGLLFD